MLFRKIGHGKGNGGVGGKKKKSVAYMRCLFPKTFLLQLYLRHAHK